jgi:hypothetical protein
LSDGVFTALDVPGSLRTAAVGINNGGQIVGWYISNDGRTLGFVATPE